MNSYELVFVTFRYEHETIEMHELVGSCDQLLDMAEVVRL